MSARINNRIYFSGFSSVNYDDLSPEEILQDSRNQARISRLLNSSPERFAKRMKTETDLSTLSCISEEIMNRFEARKRSIK